MALKLQHVRLCFLAFLLHSLTEASEFKLVGDYLIGGLFDIHHASHDLNWIAPETITCAEQQFILSSYRRFQLMRFSVEEINNSTSLLPNITLGYDILDLCSDTWNFPGIFNLISVDGSIQPWNEKEKNLPKTVAVVGTYTSTATLSVAPLFMTDFIPMVSYGAASSIFSRKQRFPSFLRTVHPNKDVIEVVLKILEEFNWRWVSFLYIDDDYGRDGRNSFITAIAGTGICLAYTKGLDHDTNYQEVFDQMESLRVHTVIVFAPEWTAEDLIESAMKHNVTSKVWIAGDAWSLHKDLPKKKGIEQIGTVLGIAEPRIPIQGFRDFISSKVQSEWNNADQEKFCAQSCSCSNVTADDIINADPSFNFPVYSAVYAIAHALHNVLQCGSGACDRSITVDPHRILAELQKTNFTLLNHSIRFDENGDPKFGSYSIVFWNRSGDAETVGYYKYNPSAYQINRTKILWHGSSSGNEVPTSVCSEECPDGYKKYSQGIHKCCFDCVECESGSYINRTEDPYSCTRCGDMEWSEAGSTSCYERVEVYIPFSHVGAVLLIVFTLIFIGLTIAVSVLFAINYTTPVVRSAGGPMCFLILGCLTLCTLSVFFYFGKPTNDDCILQYVPFVLFFTVCLACFVVRSFEIVCVFKIAVKFPRLFVLWKQYHGHWLIIALAFMIQSFLLIIGYSLAPQKVYDASNTKKTIMLHCDFKFNTLTASITFVSILCFLSFSFSYCGKNLPRNYNEAKSITFCLLLLIIIWTIFGTIYLHYHGNYIHILNAAAVLSSQYSFLFWYFLPKCYIILLKPQKNTQQYFQSLIQNYTMTTKQ